MGRRVVEIERRELLGDGVQAPERPAVVVFVMALDELDREIGQRPGTAMNLLERVPHGNPPSANDERRRGARGLRARHWSDCGFDNAPLARNAYRIGRGTVLEGTTKSRGSCYPQLKRTPRPCRPQL